MFFAGSQVDYVCWRRVVGGGQSGGQSGGRDLELEVILVTGQKMVDHFLHGNIFMAGAQLSQGFFWLECAARAAADVVAGEQCAPGAGQRGQHGGDGEVWSQGRGGSSGHDQRSVYAWIGGNKLPILPKVGPLPVGRPLRISLARLGAGVMIRV